MNHLYLFDHQNQLFQQQLILNEFHVQINHKYFYVNKKGVLTAKNTVFLRYVCPMIITKFKLKKKLTLAK